MKLLFEKNDGFSATADQEKDNLFEEHLLHKFTQHQYVIDKQHKLATEINNFLKIFPSS
jgi:hypothetical protein